MGEAAGALLTASPEKDMTVLIGNRGEVAVRTIEVCRELGATAILACADQDLDSLAARLVRELGAEDGRSTIAPLRGASPSKSYENQPKVIASGKAHGATHFAPGYGFLSENAQAARALNDVGIKFIGPDPETMELVGGKEAARRLAREHNVPILDGSENLTSTEHAISEYEKLGGGPQMLKAEHAGGGNGNKVINNRQELIDAFTNMAPRFKEMHLETYVPDARHIEIQILGDGENVVAFGDRDCTAQRKFQKVIEESPAIIVAPGDVQAMTEGALKMMRAIHYKSLGTIEFLYQPATGKYWFMEVNCRAQVELPVTEERYGMNLLKLQFQLEQGEPLPLVGEPLNNHVIEARLYAERPEQDFAADSGKIQLLTIPTIEGVRVDRAYQEGDNVVAGFDTTIAKIIATGETREEAREKLVEMLTNITVTGVETNREFLLWLTNTKEFRDNTITTTFIEGAWSKHQRERFRGVEGFLEGGEFFTKPTPRRFVPEMFPQNLTYEKNGVVRDYASDREAMSETCAVKFGIYQDHATGIRIALGVWDPKVHAGTMGSEEGNAIVGLFELAKIEGGLPVAMITSSPGADQQQNMLALAQMDYVIAAAKKQFPAPLFINVFSGVNFGGVTASIANVEDIQIAVDNSLIGLTGTGMVKKMMGLKDGDKLPSGAHGVNDHYNARNIDLIVKDLAEARTRILALCSVLGLTEPHITPHPIDLRDFDSVSPGTRHDRPPEQRYPARIGNLTETIFRKAKKKVGGGRPRAELTPQKRLELIMNPLRPTAADLLHPDLNIFQNVSPLSHKTTLDSLEQYPAIIGAFAELGGEPVMVLGQQTQRRKDHLRRLHKVYVPQGPNDFRWAQRKIDLAERLGLPIIFIGDTAGASAYLEDEKNGISRQIAEFLARIHNVKVPVISLNIGQNGSGGGLTFIRPMDAAADSSNSLSLVSTIDVMNRIVLGKWPRNTAERAVLLNQIKDGTPEGRLLMGQIDEIIPEPTGGAHTDWIAYAKNIREFFLKAKLRVESMPIDQLLAERYDRIERPAQFATRPIVATIHG